MPGCINLPYIHSRFLCYSQYYLSLRDFCIDLLSYSDQRNRNRLGQIMQQQFWYRPYYLLCNLQPCWKYPHRHNILEKNLKKITNCKDTVLMIHLLAILNITLFFRIISPVDKIPTNTTITPDINIMQTCGDDLLTPATNIMKY